MGKKNKEIKEGIDNRELTEKEKARKIIFEKNKAELLADGYKDVPLTISVMSANTVGMFTTLPFVIIMVVLFFVFNKDGEFVYICKEYDTLIQFAIFCVLIVVHELIHGLVWGLCAKKKFKSIEFGVIWKMLTPYCTCTEPLNKWQYILGAAMPTIILGFVLGGVAVAIGSVTFLVVSVLLIIGGSGDFYAILKILRYKTTSKNILYCDHPYELGGVVFER